MGRWWTAAVGRVRGAWAPVVEAALAATVAWLIAARLIGHPDPFFAPSAALIVLGESRGQRVRQSIELILGVAAGVLIADLVVHALGPGTATMLLVLLVTLGVTVAAGASSTLIVQTTISALYLVAVAVPKGEFTPFRFVDALIGGAVALAVSQLMVARNPLAPLVAEARQTYTDLADVLDRVGDALRRRDEEAAQAALVRARQLEGCMERLRGALHASAETLRLRVRRRRRLGQLAQVDATAQQLDDAVRNVRVLARNGLTLTRLPIATPPELGAAIRCLAEAVRAAGAALATDLTGEDADAHAVRADDTALTAVRMAAELLRAQPPLPVVMIVGQIRATAIDLVRGLGKDDVAVLSRVDEVLGLPTR
ncbi:FUSC family protein [Micromonospora soli]|uniref:FUSC family protein n=1 Tax=Micromonospora sp. NBRC 110009 TaxID=3061627 RepID=UPI0026711529|nr:FUSC family protein [Micromonospora sp. NBRC 110009]WKT97087.1 FUSC family protein [Micromonospora sp. NBRC 110009]